MASLYGVEYTNAVNDVPSEKALPNKWGSRLRSTYDSYTILADLAVGDKIYLGRLPKGARIIDVIVAFADLDTSGGTVDVGYEYADATLTDDLDGFASGIDVTSAGAYSMSADGANMAGFGYELTGETDIVVTTVGDTDATSGDIKVCVIWAGA